MIELPSVVAKILSTCEPSKSSVGISISTNCSGIAFSGSPSSIMLYEVPASLGSFKPSASNSFK